MLIEEVNRTYDPATKCWAYRNAEGQLHRNDDKPARVCKFGKMWAKNGEYHRDGDKPAVVYYHDDGGSDRIGDRYWFNEGKYHRKNGPASIQMQSDFKTVTLDWYENGKHIKTEYVQGFPDDMGVLVNAD